MERQRIYDKAGIEAFAKRFKEIRVKYGYTQEELSHQSEITLSQIARLETARINPSLSTIFTLARAMNVPLTELFDFTLPQKK